MRRWGLLAGLVVALAVGLVLVLQGGAERVEAGDDPPEIPVIARRVEKLRGLEFKHLPKVRRITRRQLQRRSEGELGDLGAKERRALENDQELAKLLGFESRDAKAEDSASTEGILGFYDPKSDELRIVTDAQGSRGQLELTIAHELTHALEDQRFGIGRDPSSDDASTAYRALSEGSAHLVETQYARKFLGGDKTVRELAAGPPRSTVKGKFSYGANSLRFAYLDGSRFVAQVKRRGGEKAVDGAFRKPPRTTEAVLHPEAYFAAERKEPVRLAVRSIAGKTFKPVVSGTLGEFDTSQMLLLGAAVDDETTKREAAAGAAGWAGGRYELWRAGTRGDRGCSNPCVERDLLTIRWRFDKTPDAAQFATRLEPYLEVFQKLRPGSGGVYKGRAASAAVAARGKVVTLVIAPAAQLAKLVAHRA